VDAVEFARWSRAVLAILSRSPGSLSSEEIAEGIGDYDAQTLAQVLAEMANRGLILPDPDRSSPTGGTTWRHR
jgi:DNA-binding HxlR family transcriptional regulator